VESGSKENTPTGNRAAKRPNITNKIKKVLVNFAKFIIFTPYGTASVD
jgi:hypothetical protein